MPDERYKGERAALRLFLTEILDTVSSMDEKPEFLAASIGRGLRTNSMSHLRHARGIFHRLPEDHKKAIMAQLFKNGKP